jgi:hypothetical protein
VFSTFQALSCQPGRQVYPFQEYDKPGRPEIP